MEAADLLEAVVDAATGQTGEGPAHIRFAAAWGLDATAPISSAGPWFCWPTTS
jgi:hypothetical protein